ncbi:MAG: oxidoreductase [Bacteroidota bacterium]
MPARKSSIAVFKFSSCDGCQLSFLNMEAELLDLAGAVEIAYFLEASRASLPGPYDLALVEGSVTTPHEVERIHQIRHNCSILVALGTCATSGGIQALRNFADAEAYASTVYPHPEYLAYLKTATPIAEHVKVDFELWGCPVAKGQLLEIVTALINGRNPVLPPYSVCLECKRRSAVCVMVDQGIPCLGPATQAGCGAVCPSCGRGCYGCFGPLRTANLGSLSAILARTQRAPGEAVRLLRGISGNAPAFRAAAGALIAGKEAR